MMNYYIILYNKKIIEKLDKRGCQWKTSTCSITGERVTY